MSKVALSAPGLPPPWGFLHFYYKSAEQRSVCLPTFGRRRSKLRMSHMMDDGFCPIAE
ncbi:hypothetical protein NC981_10145 [Leptolyngbya sp. DQ-M1]|uniref:hypothetical protein n=1 Tax=Leptolyngbya sp. DQ-M1 TaxID=2933920 RepID=UPI00329984A1